MNPDAFTGPLGGYLLALGVIGGLLKLYMQGLREAREDRAAAEVRNDARWKVVSDLTAAMRESNTLIRDMRHDS